MALGQDQTWGTLVESKRSLTPVCGKTQHVVRNGGFASSHKPFLIM